MGALPSQDVLGVFRALKDDLQTSVLTPRGLSLKSAGTKALALVEPIDPISGYWANPQAISSKPPRWIVQVHTDKKNVAKAQFGLNPNGKQYSSAQTVGYINNRDGSCAIVAFRVLIAAKPHRAGQFVFPDWECLLLLAFSQPLHAGTSGDPLSDFNPLKATISIGGGAAKKSYALACTAIVKVPTSTASVPGLNYDDAAAAVALFANAKLYDGRLSVDRDRIRADLQAVLATPSAAAGPFSLPPDTALVGIDPGVYSQIEAAINSGKRHIILYGPPGTGKTTLAEYLAREACEHDGGDGSYTMLTASSAWTSQDLVGGYQPLGVGKIGFVAGALLRGFDRPAIIDELNRCPIDKVMGPLFSVLSGQASTLPCRAKVDDEASPFHVVLPEQRSGMAAHEHAPGPAWRLICTLNTYDKTQLGQISYALSRRFAWIKVGAPSDVGGFVADMAARAGYAVPAQIAVNPVGDMWRSVNEVREIGGAPIIDFIRTLKAMDGTTDPFVLPSAATMDTFLAAFRMCVLPLMDGLSPRDAASLAESVGNAWKLDTLRAERLKGDCREFST